MRTAGESTVDLYKKDLRDIHLLRTFCLILICSILGYWLCSGSVRDLFRNLYTWIIALCRFCTERTVKSPFRYLIFQIGSVLRVWSDHLLFDLVNIQKCGSGLLSSRRGSISPVFHCDDEGKEWSFSFFLDEINIRNPGDYLKVE